MHLTTNLRNIRGERSVKEIADASGIAAGSIRQLEQGRLVPKDEWIPKLEEAYGLRIGNWYTTLSLIALQEGDGT